MKRSIIIILLSVVLFASVAFAQQVPSDLTWKLRALAAEFKIAKEQLDNAQQAINEFVKELDAKGFMLSKDGRIVQKPVPAPEEPKK